MTPFAQATPSQIAAHQAHQARLGRIWKPQDRPVAQRKVVTIAPPPKPPVVPVEAVPIQIGHDSLDMLAGPSWRFILDLVCMKHGVGRRDILGPSHYYTICRVRYEFAWLLKFNMGLSLTRIGQILNRDHTTILHGLRQHAKRNGLPRPPVQPRNPSLLERTLQLHLAHPEYTRLDIARETGMKVVTSGIYLSKARSMALIMRRQNASPDIIETRA